MYKDCYPISEHKISDFLYEIGNEKYYWNINIADRLLHESYCKYIFIKGKNKGIMCKKKSIGCNNYCQLHYNADDKFQIYNRIRCSFLNRDDKPCGRIVKKDGDVCNYHEKYLFKPLPTPDEKELLYFGIPYDDIYDINKIDVDVFTYNIDFFDNRKINKTMNLIMKIEIKHI